jgi:hypothetical protein
MPGISGVVASRTPIERPDDVLASFEEVHSFDGVRFEHRRHRSTHAVIHNALTGLIKANLEQPAVSPDGDAVLFLEGEVFNQDDLKAMVKGPDGGAPCSVLLSLFVERGPDFVSLLDGNFNVVIHEARENRLTILNDRFSAKPMYYLEESGALVFGSEKKSVLRAAKGSPVVDGLGILQVFAHRHNLGGRTFIEGLRCLPPASRLVYHEGRISLRSYGRLGFNVPRSLPPVARLVEEWADHLRQAAWKRLKGKERILMSLSGGLDSRAVACAIPRDLRPIAARTRGFPDSPEVICASEIASRLGFSHFLEDPVTVKLSESIPRIVWRTECAVTFVNCLTATNHAQMKEHGDFIVGGQFGDVSSGAHIYPYMLLPRTRRQFIERAFRWYRVYTHDVLRRVFNEDFLRRYDPLLKDAFFESFDSIEADSNIALYELWDVAERQARMTLGSGPVDSHLFEKPYPFLDGSYMAFVHTLPTRLRFGQGLYQAMIYHLGPEIRDVPNANTGWKLRPTVAGNLWNKGISLAAQARGKALNRLGLGPRSSVELRVSTEGISGAIRKDPQFRRGIEDFARANDFDASIFDGPGILKLLDEHARGSDAHVHLLCILATFAEGLPRFVYRRQLRSPVA